MNRGHSFRRMRGQNRRQQARQELVLSRKNQRTGIVGADLSSKLNVLERTLFMKTHAKREFVCDIDWHWSDSLPAQGIPKPVKKSQTLTLTMSHNPTRISLVRSIPSAQIKQDTFSRRRSQLWLELLDELQRQALIRGTRTQVAIDV
jgi:hypothetical protein